jgi:hypothetical protein
MLARLGFAWLIAAACAAPALAACGSGDTSSAAGGGDATGGSAVGGSHAGGTASGGSSSGGSHPGGAQSGGSGGATSGGATSGGCHDASECPVPTQPPFGGTTMCLLPGQTPPAGGCGFPMWCGQCSCPPQPPTPLGNGQACQTSADCPKLMAGIATATVCAAGQCTECAENSDCSETAPVCGAVQGGFIGNLGFRMCTACALDAQCPNERPHCQLNYGLSKCVACVTSAECATGVCVEGSCTPGCGDDKPCGAALECSPELRCVPLSCGDDSGCPVNMACNAGHCTRKACSSDGTCQGACVNGFCYDSLGTCYTQLAVP